MGSAGTASELVASDGVRLEPLRAAGVPQVLVAVEGALAPAAIPGDLRR